MYEKYHTKGWQQVNKGNLSRHCYKKNHYFVTFSGQWQIVMLRVTSSNAYVCIMHARKSH